MIKRTSFVFCFMATICITMTAQLFALNMPRYAQLARQARVRGIVKVAFMLLPHAEEPTKEQLVSGSPISMGTAVEERRS